MTNMPKHPRTMGQRQQSTQSPMPGTRPQPQPGKQGNKTRPTPTPRLPKGNTQPKMAGSPKCKLRTSIGRCTPHRQSSRHPPGQPGSQADPTMHHPAHHHARALFCSGGLLYSGSHWDDLRAVRLNSVSAWDNLRAARLNSWFRMGQPSSRPPELCFVSGPGFVRVVFYF
ncbi:hypothetical protein AMECASPLE_015209 [Ameca splendens]|uniref:Uncharacterized protein n=1 Tax=Ameca splendens TaxID=208324 RepID=A0ABV0ZXL5_9TELE